MTCFLHCLSTPGLVGDLFVKITENTVSFTLNTRDRNMYSENSGMSQFEPGIEAEATDSGEIIIDGEGLKCLPNLKDENTCPASVRHIVKEAVSDYGDECFLLKNVFSEQECTHFITEGETAGFEEINFARQDYRSAHRISFQSNHLASMVWQRIVPYLHNIVLEGDPHDVHIEGVASLMKGTWVPRGLNDVFRLCRYFPGGHFAPHRDGFFVRSTTERSLQTFMLYLNGNFHGGSTNFIDPSQQLYKGPDGKYCAEDKNVLCRIQPESGLAIIFNHNRLHEGQKLGNGVKYILRTDIMFENINPVERSPAEDKALCLLQEADRLEAAGQCIEAMELYRKAYKLCPELDGAHSV